MTGSEVTARTALLLLADARLPAGGHAHSGGMEAAVAAGRVHDVSTLDAFLRGRLATAGLVSAAFAAAACARPSTVDVLDPALDARTPSPALRRASRQQGRALIRAGRAMWPAVPVVLRDGPHAHRDGPHAHRDGPHAYREGPHHPVALGVVAAAAGLGPPDAALVAASAAVSGPASAAVRLLGLDPYAVHALLAALAGACDAVASEAVARDAVASTVDELPAAGAPLLDIGAEIHASWEVRLFAS